MLILHKPVAICFQKWNYCKEDVLHFLGGIRKTSRQLFPSSEKFQENFPCGQSSRCIDDQCNQKCHYVRERCGDAYRKRTMSRALKRKVFIKLTVCIEMFEKNPQAVGNPVASSFAACVALRIFNVALSDRVIPNGEKSSFIAALKWNHQISNAEKKTCKMKHNTAAVMSGQMENACCTFGTTCKN